MMQYCRLTMDEIDKVSEQIKASYTHAYRGLMSSEYLDSLTKHHWSPILRSSMENGDICIVAKKDQEIIGSAVFGVSDDESGKYSEWHSFYLLPKHIGRGIGHSFYQHIEGEMLAQACRRCELEVLSANERAVRFYLAHGYCKTQTFMVEEYGMTLLCDKMIKKLHSSLT